VEYVARLAVVWPPAQHGPGRLRCQGSGCEAWFASPVRCCVRLCPKGRAKQGREYMPPAAATAACPGGGYQDE
jgi:hypothetical protein